MGVCETGIGLGAGFALTAVAYLLGGAVYGAFVHRYHVRRLQAQAGAEG